MKVFIALLAYCALVYGQTGGEDMLERVPRVIADFNATFGIGRLAENAITSLADAFAGESGQAGYVIVNVRNPSRRISLDVTWSLFLHERCIEEEGVAIANSQSAIPVANGSVISIDLSSTEIDSQGTACGAVSLCINVTASGMRPGVARLGLFEDCAQGPVDFAVEHPSFNVDEVHSVVWGRPLLEQLPGLEGLLLKNLGDNDVNQKSRYSDLKDSVVAFARIDPVSETDIENVMNGECMGEDWYYGDYEGSGSYEDYYYNYDLGDMNFDPSNGFRFKRSAVKSLMRKKRSDRQKRSHDDMSEIEWMYEEWRMKRAMVDRPTDIPVCLNQRFIAFDEPLHGGDIFVDAVPAGGQFEIDLSSVFLRSKTHPCHARDRNNIASAQIIISPDPLGLYNDTDYCNDAIFINVTMECPDTVYDDMGNQDMYCDLMTNPLTRGHEAAMLVWGHPYVKYDGQGLQYAEEFYQCFNIEYYLRMTDLIRFRLLANRYQRQIDRDPRICEDVEQWELGEERELMSRNRDDGGERMRMKRQTRPPPPDGGGDGEDGMGDRLNPEDGIDIMREFARNVSRDFEEAVEHQGFMLATHYVCISEHILLLVDRFQEALLALPENDNLLQHLERAHQLIQDLIVAHSLYEYDCSENFGPDDFDTGDETGYVMDMIDQVWEQGDEQRVEALTAAFQEFAFQNMLRERLENGTFEDRFHELLDSYSEQEGTCPGHRGKVPNIGRTVAKKIKEMAGKVLEAKKRGAVLGELPRNTCGMRKVRQVLRLGAWRSINTDMLQTVLYRYTKQDEKLDLVRFAGAVNHSLAMTHDVDEIPFFIEQMMNETADDEVLRCGMDFLMRRMYYKLDDNFNIYWKLEGGKLFKGISDLFGRTYGQDVNGRRMILWTQVASCSCNQCDSQYFLSPDREREESWPGGYDYGYYYNSTTTDYNY